MDPPTELPLNGSHEELALGKINWLPAEERREEKKEGRRGKSELDERE